MAEHVPHEPQETFQSKVLNKVANDLVEETIGASPDSRTPEEIESALKWFLGECFDDQEARLVEAGGHAEALAAKDGYRSKVLEKLAHHLVVEKEGAPVDERSPDERKVAVKSFLEHFFLEEGVAIAEAGEPVSIADEDCVEPDLKAESFAPVRRRLPDTRQSLTHKFTVDTHEGYLTVGMYEDGRPGEVFIKMAKEGSTLSGLMDTVSILTSMLLQHGVEVSTIAAKLKDTNFEPNGFTKSEIVGECSSISDYIFRWMDHVFSEEQSDKGS